MITVWTFTVDLWSSGGGAVPDRSARGCSTPPSPAPLIGVCADLASDAPAGPRAQSNELVFSRTQSGCLLKLISEGPWGLVDANY